MADEVQNTSAAATSTASTTHISVPQAASAVSIKAPVFTERNPSAWFLILDAQFHLGNITSEATKFYHAVAGLPPDLIAKLPDDTFQNAHYGHLKKTICAYLEPTKPELVDQFLASLPVAGRPSHHLAEMKRLASQIGASEDLIRHKFYKTLPPHIGPILMTQRQAPLEDLGRLADELVALAPAPNHIAVVNRPASPERRLENRSPRTHRPNSPEHRRENSREALTGLQPFSPDQRSRVCRWHIYFGARARKCRPWCEWPEKKGCTVLDSRSSSPTPPSGN